MFFFNKIREQEGRTGSAWRRWVEGWEVTQIMYTSVKKCKNDKVNLKSLKKGKC
jgi:glycyl-tRNA synthetase alpha subunit